MHALRRLSLFQGILPLRRPRILKDVLAGIMLAAMNIPQVLGYTRIAGAPVVTGLYTLLLPLLAFAIFGSSRYLVVSADSATAAILAGTLASMAAPESARYMALAGLAALMTGGFLIVARLLKLGFLADFLSQTVLVGFLTGVGFQVGIAVLGQMLGIQVRSSRTVRQLFELLSRDYRLVTDSHSSLLGSACAVFLFLDEEEPDSIRDTLNYSISVGSLIYVIGLANQG